VPKDLTLARLETALGVPLRQPPAAPTRTHGAALRELRLQRRWTVAKCAEYTGLTFSRIRRLEKGNYVPKGGWDAFFDDDGLAVSFDFKDEQALYASVNLWLDGNNLPLPCQRD